jgi:hypothetical protein
MIFIEIEQNQDNQPRTVVNYDNQNMKGSVPSPNNIPKV